MRPFDTLIRLAEQTLDDKRRELGVLQDRLAQAEDHRRVLDDEFRAEQEAAKRNPGPMQTIGAYAQHMVERREQADAAIVEARRRVEEQREEVRLAFAELKRYEITHEARKAKLAAEEARKEQNMLDEVAEATRRRADDRL